MNNELKDIKQKYTDLLKEYNNLERKKEEIEIENKSKDEVICETQKHIQFLLKKTITNESISKEEYIKLKEMSNNNEKEIEVYI